MTPFGTACRHLTDCYLHVTTVLAFHAPLILLLLLLNLRGVQPDPLVVFYVFAVVMGYYVFPFLLILSVFSLPFLFSKRLTFFVVGVMLTCVTYYLLVDHLVYNVVRFHIDAFWLDYLIHDFGGLGLPTSSVVVAVLALIALGFLEWGLFRAAPRVPRPKALLLSLVVLGVLGLASSQVIHVAAYENNASRITSLTPHFPFYVPLVSHSQAVKYGSLVPIQSRAANHGPDGRTYHSITYPLREIQAAPPQRPLNVVFILLESWRFDTMDSSVTPNIFALSQKATTFRDHLSSGNSTIAGLFGLFYGLHPTYWTAVKSNNVAIHNPVLIDLMQDAGYSFGIYADSHFERHKIKDTVFRDIEVHESFSGATHANRDEDMKNQAVSFLRQQTSASRPFMLFTFFKSSHYHYYYPDSYRKFTPSQEMNIGIKSRAANRTAYLNDYRNSIYYSDALVGDILDELESLGFMDNTVVVITTEHGEEFNDNGANYWGHGSNFTQYQTRVPLVIYYPGREPAVVTRPTAHVDIPTTLLQDVFAVRNPVSEYSNGRNLFRPQTKDRPLVVAGYVNHALVLGDDVHAVFPLYTREYALRDINEKVSGTHLDLVKTAIEEMARFYGVKSPPVE